jgi:hypothetical protein
MEDFSGTPHPGCPAELDQEAWSDQTMPNAAERSQLLSLTTHLALLVYANAYDHLHTLGRVLGGDGSMPLFSHATASRVICEAAVRFAWQLDPGVSSDERIVRGAVAILDSEEQRLKGATRLPTTFRLRQPLVDRSAGELDQARRIITAAGIGLVHSRDGKSVARLELGSVSVPMKLDITGLTSGLLVESPTWYNISSAVTHSLYWGLRDVVTSRPGEPVALIPELLDVGAAAESAISASGLILSRCAAYYSRDASSHFQATAGRRELIDSMMRQIGKARLERRTRN